MTTAALVAAAQPLALPVVERSIDAFVARGTSRNVRLANREAMIGACAIETLRTATAIVEAVRDDRVNARHHQRQLAAIQANAQAVSDLAAAVTAGLDVVSAADPDGVTDLLQSLLDTTRIIWAPQLAPAAQVP